MIARGGLALRFGASRVVAFGLALASIGGIAAFAASPRPAPMEPAGLPDRAGWSDFLSRSEVGADLWSKAHPEWDGRGVVIAVLDTGVDPSVPGLDKLPTGGPKLIEARDFSGEGHVALTRAERDGETLRAGKVSVRGALSLGDKPLRPNDYWLGAFDEKQLQNGAVDDIDNNGRSDDRFAVLAFRRAPDGEEVSVIDSDGDGDLADEVVRRAYGADPTWFTFGRPGEPRGKKAPVAVAATAVLDEKRVELHFDDGSHGSHCAGIAAGYGIEGRNGFDGIAPGARLMSLKIGHNALSGGATTRGSMAEAISFASRWAREHQTPVVMNLSYGVGSEVEGAGDIQRLLDDELQSNRWLAAALSAGNEGPGLSSVGNPGGTLFGWTAGALVPDLAWDTLFAAKRGKTKKIFAFSSRGGELDKPDGLTPGVAWSTVPPYLQKAVKNGTSMAAPQAAGVMALLISGALADKRPWTPGIVKRAMRASARPIAGYSSLEQGAGIVNVSGAWEVLTRSAAKNDAGALEVAGWKVATPAPGRPGTTAQASYWRVGGYVPDKDERISFKVEPRFYGDVGEAAVGRHFDTFELDSDVGWLRLDRSKVGMRGAAPVDIQVGIDRGALDASGQHVGRVRAKRNGIVAFELPVVVIVPETFRGDSAREWTRTFTGRLDPGDVARVFVLIPPGATGMRAELVIPGSAYGNVWLVPFTPEGHHFEAFEHRASSLDVLTADVGIDGADLQTGTWELTMFAPLANRAVSPFELTVSFSALTAPAELAVVNDSDGLTTASLALTNKLGEPFRGSIAAIIDGYERSKTLTAKGERTKLAFDVAPGDVGVDFELELTSAVWDRFTDIAVNIVDGRGKALEQGAFGQRKSFIGVDAAPGSYTLEIIGGHADKDDEREWKIDLVERHRVGQAATFAVDLPTGMATATLYPGVETRFGLSVARPPAPPTGFRSRAVVTLTNRDGSTWTRLRLPLVPQR